MSKGPSDSQFSILLLNVEGEVINGVTSARDLKGTKRLALDALRLDDQAAFADIYRFAHSLADLREQSPLARVGLDDELEA